MNQEKVVGVFAGKPPARRRQHSTARSMCVRLGMKSREPLTVWTGLFAANLNQEFQRDVSNETITSLVFIHVVLEEGFLLMRKHLKIILALGDPVHFCHTSHFLHVHWWLSDTGCYDGLSAETNRDLPFKPMEGPPGSYILFTTLTPPPGTHFSLRRRFF